MQRSLTSQTILAPDDSFPSSSGNMHTEDKMSMSEMKKSSLAIGVSTESQADEYVFTDELKSAIAKVSGIPWSKITSKSRKAKVVLVRCAISYYLRWCIDPCWTYEAIGALLNRDHTTVMHAEDASLSKLLYERSAFDFMTILFCLHDGAEDIRYRQKYPTFRQTREEIPELARTTHNLKKQGYRYIDISKAHGVSTSTLSKLMIKWGPLLDHEKEVGQ